MTTNNTLPRGFKQRRLLATTLTMSSGVSTVEKFTTAIQWSSYVRNLHLRELLDEPCVLNLRLWDTLDRPHVLNAFSRTSRSCMHSKLASSGNLGRPGVLSLCFREVLGRPCVLNFRPQEILGRPGVLSLCLWELLDVRAFYIACKHYGWIL